MESNTADGEPKASYATSPISELRRRKVLSSLQAIAETETPLDPARTLNRWIWGRPADGLEPGALHVEILPTDPVAVSEAMSAIRPEDRMLSRKERWKLHLVRRRAAAKRMNEEAVKSRGLVLLVKRNGDATMRLARLGFDLSMAQEAEAESGEI